MLSTAERFIAWKDTRELLMFKRGAYRPNAENEVRAKIEAAYPETTNHEKNEVVEKLIDRVMIERRNAELEAWPYLSMAEGVIDIRPGGEYLGFVDFEKAHPGVILTNPLTHLKYDPKARCPTFWRFLARGFPNPDDLTLLWDHFASTIDRRCIKRRALLLWGPPDTSKTTFLNIEGRLLGEDNIKNISLDSLCGEKDRFAISSMRGIMLNYFADLDPKLTLGYLGNFKALVGGDRMTVRAIYSKPFDFWPGVKLHFSAQVAPPLKDVTDEGWWGRWDIIHAEQPLERKDPDFAVKLADSELSGIFNELLKRFRQQYARPGFKIVRAAPEVRDIWLGMAEPAREFIRSVMFANPNSDTDAREVYPLWEKWAKSRKPAPGYVSHQRLNELIRETFQTDQTRTNGRHVWKGLGYKGQNGQTELGGVPKVLEKHSPPQTYRDRKGGRSKIPALSTLFGEPDP